MSNVQKFKISAELLDCFRAISDALRSHKEVLTGQVSDADRATVTRALGEAASVYRWKVYDHGFSGQKSELELHEVQEFVEISLDYLRHSIEANRRTDHLFHAYNLLSIHDQDWSLSYLDEMLEGQVAILSAHYLEAKDVATLLDGLRNSALYRADQNSYLLYPDRELKGFLSKNILSPESVESSQLLKELLAKGNTYIVNQDIHGGVHFNGHFRNVSDLNEALTIIKTQDHVHNTPEEHDRIRAIYEEVFNHKAFTGRSSTFFGYEGLGSIYWHMVSKLLLAVQECCYAAMRSGAPGDLLRRLITHYHEINAGIGVHKSPGLYGAFPTDPYSHTPASKGAQQPGMTGQVKEDILARFGELGVIVENGVISFYPFLLKRDSFLTQEATMSYLNTQLEEQEKILVSDSLGFTYCQVPIIYHVHTTSYIEVHYDNQETHMLPGLHLDKKTSEDLFNRTGKLDCLHIYLEEGMLFNE